MSTSKLLKIMIPALAIAVSATTGAAESARHEQAAKHPMMQKRVQAKKISEVAAEESARQASHARQRHDGINNDAGIPPSGVPTETMSA